MPPNGSPYVTATIFWVLFYQLGENQWACIPRPSTGTQYSTVQYSTVQYSTVQYSTVQYSTVQYSTVQYSTVQYSVHGW